MLLCMKNTSADYNSIASISSDLFYIAAAS